MPIYDKTYENAKKQEKVTDNQEKNLNRNKPKDDPDNGASRQGLEDIMINMLKKIEEKMDKMECKMKYINRDLVESYKRDPHEHFIVIKV